MLRMSADPRATFLTPSGVARVARLARLELAPDEFARLAPQLESIVAHIEKIAEIPDAELPEPDPPRDTPLRADTPVPGDGREEIAANARAIAHGLVPVPRVVDAAR